MTQLTTCFVEGRKGTVCNNDSLSVCFNGQTIGFIWLNELTPAEYILATEYLPQILDKYKIETVSGHRDSAYRKDSFVVIKKGNNRHPEVFPQTQEGYSKLCAYLFESIKESMGFIKYTIETDLPSPTPKAA